jgi:uncharacterized protein DUF4365
MWSGARESHRTLRKRRTRSHVLAELSANHVEKQALLCGYSVERVVHDYGLDLVLYTYDAGGEIENGAIYLQLKATDALNMLSDDQTISFSLDRADLEYWLPEPMPVILIVYDGQSGVAHWLYLQAHFEGQSGFDLASIGNTITVHLDRTRILDSTAMREFARFRDDVLAQVEGTIRHHA